MDDPITVTMSVAITILTLAASIGGAWAVTRHLASRAADRVDALERDLATFKIQVAQNYVANDVLIRLEERVVDSIMRLGDRLDRILERHGP